MLNKLTIRTLNETAYIDGKIIYDDLSNMIMSMIGNHKTRELVICSQPFENGEMAMSIGNIGNTRIYKCPHGTFTVCLKELHTQQIGKTFYYKINKT